MPANDLEVFDHLCSDENTQVEIDYLTYAIFAHRKRHWIEQFAARNSRLPSRNEVDAWITNLTDYDYNRMRSEAADFFEAAASDYMQRELDSAFERGKAEAETSKIAQINVQIRSIGRLRNQLLLALVTAVLVPPILGGFIFGVRQFELFMPTISTFLATSPPTAPSPMPAPPGTPGKS